MREQVERQGLTISPGAREQMSDQTEPTLGYADFPALFQASDQGSVEGQRRYKRLASFELILLVIGAAAGTALALVSDSERVGAAIGGVAFLAALSVRLVGRQRADDESWFDGRAVAETVKTDAWRYISAAPPFDGLDADRVFGERLTAALRARPNIALTGTPLAPTLQQITPVMRRLHARPLADRHRRYLKERLDHQISWYRRSAERQARSGRRWTAAAIGAEAAAVSSTVLIFVSESIAHLGLLGLFGSLAAAFAAWNQLGRHGELAKAYALAHQELLTIRSIHDVVETDEEFAQMVDDTERAISREHTMWMANRIERPPTASG